HLRHERPDDLRRDLARVDQELLPARVRREDLTEAGGGVVAVEDVGSDATDLQQLLRRIEGAVLRAVRAREAEAGGAFGAVQADLVVAVAPIDDRVRDLVDLVLGVLVDARRLIAAPDEVRDHELDELAIHRALVAGQVDVERDLAVLAGEPYRELA